MSFQSIELPRDAEGREIPLSTRDYLQSRRLEEHKDGRIATMMADLVSRAKALAEREKNAE